MSSKCLVTSHFNMALTTQILMVCAIVGLSNAYGPPNHRHHRPQNDLGDLPQLLTDMFHPGNPMQGLLQIHPINRPGILGFNSFTGQGLGNFGDAMFGQGQGGYGTEESMPVTSASFERDDGNAPGPVYDFNEQGRDPFVGSQTPQDAFDDQFNNNDKEMDQNKHDDTDNSNIDKESGKSNSVGKETDNQKMVDSSEKDGNSDPSRNNSENNSVSKHRDKDAIIFPDRVDQAKDQISKESSYYVSPQPSNAYVSSPGPQIIYAVSVTPSGSSSNQVPYATNTVPSNSQSQPKVNTVQTYPSSNNINVQNPQPQYQTNGNAPMGNVVLNKPTTNPSYTLVPISNNGANGNSPVYSTNNPPVSNPPQNVNYQPLNLGQQYYLVSMNGQNMLVPVNNVQTVPNQSNGNNQINLIPINQGSYVPSNSQINYVPLNNQNVPPSTPQSNGQVQYVAVQLAPQNNVQNNNQASYVPANQGTIQTPGQNTAQGSVNYVPVNTQPPMQMPPQNNNQVTYVSGNPQQVVQMAPQNPPQSNNQINYVPANPQTVVQVGPNNPTNSGQVTYVPLNPQNPQNPQSTTQYNLVPLNQQNNGQSNLVTLVPATLTSNGNVPLLVFKEKAKLSSKDKKKNNE